MKIKITDEIDRHTLLGWFVLCALTENDNTQEVIDAASPEDAKEGVHEIKLVINGVDTPVNIEDIFKRMESHMDEEIRKGAVELVEKNFDALDSAVNYLRKVVKKKMVDDLGLKWNEFSESYE